MEQVLYGKKFYICDFCKGTLTKENGYVGIADPVALAKKKYKLVDICYICYQKRLEKAKEIVLE